MSQGTHAAGDGSFGRSAGIQGGRALLLIGLAVVIGFVLLHRVHGSSYSLPGSTSGPPNSVGAGTPSGTTGRTGSTLPNFPGSTSSTLPLRAPGSVKVLVANGTSTAGLAGRVSTTLRGKGYNTLSPTDSTQKPASTLVYFAPGYGPDAAALAVRLGLSATAVSALPTPPPVTNLNGANILVLAGPDLARTTTTSTT